MYLLSYECLLSYLATHWYLGSTTIQNGVAKIKRQWTLKEDKKLIEVLVELRIARILGVTTVLN